MTIGLPLQADIGSERYELVDVEPAPLDPRNAVTEVLAAYLERLEFRQYSSDGTKTFKLNQVLSNWPDSGEQLNYPAASIDDATLPHEPHDLVPTMLEDTCDQFCQGTVLWKTGELVGELQVDFWTNTEPDREAIAAALPAKFNLTEVRSGILLSGHERYWCRPVRVTLISQDRLDTSSTVYQRERRLRTVMQTEVDVVHLRAVGTLTPTVIFL